MSDTQIDATDERSSERGQGLVEYSFILILVALLLILSVALIGHTTTSIYSNVANAINQ